MNNPENRPAEPWRGDSNDPQGVDGGVSLPEPSAEPATLQSAPAEPGVPQQPGGADQPVVAQQPAVSQQYETQQYPDLPQQVKNIQLSMQVQNPDGCWDWWGYSCKNAQALYYSRDAVQIKAIHAMLDRLCN